MYPLAYNDGTGGWLFGLCTNQANAKDQIRQTGTNVNAKSQFCANSLSLSPTFARNANICDFLWLCWGPTVDLLMGMGVWDSN